MKTFLTILITAVLTAGGAWLIKDRITPAHSHADSGERKPLFYQSPMHPWIKSDKAGRCTICGMELVPIYPGEKALDATGGKNVVALTQNQVQVMNVRTAEAKVQPLSRSLQVAGVIDDDNSRHRIISAYIEGRVEKLHVNYVGADVTAGQPLAEFYSPALLQAEREYRQLTGDLRKNTALRLRQMGLTNEQIDAVSSKPAEVLTSQILSPIGGTVVSQSVYEGQYVGTGERLFEIADFSTMWFEFLAYEQDMPWIRLGQMVTVTTPSLPGKSFEGKITFIDPNFDPTTRSTKVRVELPNPLVDGRRQLLHQLYADGTVKVDANDALSIPRTAIIRTGPQAVVYLDQGGGAYKQVTVETGRRGDALVEILSGLKPGDKVVTSGNLLIDGQAELNRSFTEEEPAAPSGSLTEAQQTAFREFVKVTDAMSAALAADNLDAFNKAAEPAMMTTGALTEALAGLPVPKNKLEELDGSRHFHGSPAIGEARARFLRFSMAAIGVLEPLRKMEGFPGMAIWECPMVSQAVPDSPDKGRWIQAAGRPIGNPYFGSEMPDCGEEIKP